MARFKETPGQVEFVIDAKDRADVHPADLAEITTHAVQDNIGQSLPTQMQITSVEEHAPGHALRVTAQSHQFRARVGYVTENSRPDYNASTPEQREQGCYLVDANNPVFPDGTPPYLRHTLWRVRSSRVVPWY